MKVICTIVILSQTPQGLYRDWVQVPGVTIKDTGEKWYVDFSKYFIKHRVDLALQSQVQWVSDNNCQRSE